MPDYSEYNVHKGYCVDGTIPANILHSLITDQTRNDFKEWLGEEGIRCFGGKTEKQLTAMHIIGGGMQVRNWMRGRDEFEGFTDHNYDDNWIEVVQFILNE